jgi:hypothetical protein
MVRNPVQALPVPVRIGTILSMLWSHLTSGPVRLIPLPLALDWAERHADEGQRTWRGSALVQHALDQVWRFCAPKGDR